MKRNGKERRVKRRVIGAVVFEFKREARQEMPFQAFKVA
jgi:hypothetical protein